MNIVDISFKTDGRTIEVPPDKGRGKLKVATKEDLLKNKDEYILFGKAKNNKSREGMEH